MQHHVKQNASDKKTTKNGVVAGRLKQPPQTKRTTPRGTTLKTELVEGVAKLFKKCETFHDNYCCIEF